MSISRGNWSSLSRLAQQWIEDDEEEQVRERRRRNRDLSTASKVVEVFPETGSSGSKPMSSAASPKDRKELLNTEQPEKLQAHNQEKTETSKQNESNKLTSSEVEESKVSTTETLEVKQTKSPAQEKQKVTNEKEESQNHSNTSNNIYNQTENTTSDSPKESILSKNQECVEPEGVKGTLQNNQNVQRLSQKFSSWKEKEHTVKVQKTQLKETSSQINKGPKEETKDISDIKAQDHPTQGLNSSGTFNDSGSIVSSEPQNETNTSSNHGSQSKNKTRMYVSSVKIPRRTSSGCSIKSPPPVPEAIEEEPFPDTKAVKSDVISPVSSSNLNGKQDSLPSFQQTATSIVRLAPLSSPVQVKSQSEDDQNDSGFTRRSSVRLSLRSRKIDDRMEKYTSALQRSASVRVAPSHSRVSIAASDGVAAKKSIFEKDEENSGKSNISRKDLTLSGSVTSRINQWSKKVQQGSGTVTSPKDFRTGDVATKRMLWQQRSQTSSDTKL